MTKTMIRNYVRMIMYSTDRMPRESVRRWRENAYDYTSRPVRSSRQRRNTRVCGLRTVAHFRKRGRRTGGHLGPAGAVAGGHAAGSSARRVAGQDAAHQALLSAAEL